MLEEGKDFAFVDFKNTDITGIQMIAGDYEGVVYHYHQAKVVEEGEMARLKFGFTIIHPGKHDIDLLKDDEDFVINFFYDEATKAEKLREMNEGR
jgi:hypothetical protein